MSLDKAIKSGKEHRKPYRRSKSIDRSCRNHGSCDYCLGNRTHANNKRELTAQEKLNEYYLNSYRMFGNVFMSDDEFYDFINDYIE